MISGLTLRADAPIPYCLYLMQISISMRLYPININISNKNILIVGGGNVALRKIKILLKYTPNIKVVADKILPAIKKIEKKGLIKVFERKYREDDINGIALVIGATSSKDTNEKIFIDATKKFVLCNIVDDPALCSFTVPSIIERGDLCVTIHTNGKCPTLSKEIRKKIEKIITKEYGNLLALLNATRQRLIKEKKSSKKIAIKLREIINSNILERIKKNTKGKKI